MSVASDLSEEEGFLHSISEQLKKQSHNVFVLELNISAESANSAEQLNALSEYFSDNQQISILTLRFSSIKFEGNLLELPKLQNLKKLNLFFNHAELDGSIPFRILQKLSANFTLLQSLSVEFSYSYLTEFASDNDLKALMQSFVNLSSIVIKSADSTQEQNIFSKIVNTILAGDSARNVEIYFQDQYYYKEDQENSESNSSENFCYFDQDKPSISTILLNFHSFEAVKTISQTYIDSLSNTLKHLPNVTHLQLNLPRYSIQPESLIKPLKLLSTLSKLKQIKLDLYGNSIKIEGMLTLNQSLSQLLSLETIVISFNDNTLEGNGFKNVDEFFAKCLHLKKLDLAFYDCSGEKNNFTSLATHLNLANNLSYLCLDISGIGCDSEFAVPFGKSLGQLTLLRELRMFFNGNNFTDKDIQEISLGLDKIEGLEQISVHLNANYVTGVGAQLLKQSLSKKKKLINIDQNFEWNRNNADHDCFVEENLVSDGNCLQNLEMSFRDGELNQKSIDYMYNVLKSCQKVDTLIFDVKHQFFESVQNQPLPLKDGLKQLKRLYIYSDLDYLELKKFKKFIMRKSLKLLEFIYLDQIQF